MSYYSSSSDRYATYPRKRRRLTAPSQSRQSPYAAERRRMSYRSKGLVTRIPRGIYTFVRCTKNTGGNSQALTFSVTQNTSTYGTLGFILEYLPGYTDFTALYDMYRVKSLVFVAQSGWTSSDELVGSGAHLDNAGIFLHTVVDTNDSTNPTLDVMRQYPSYKMTRITDLNGQRHRQFIRPQIRLATDGSGGVSINPRDAWISTDSPDTTHYAIKWAITRPAGTSPIVDMTIDWFFKATIECKNVK